MLEIRRNKTAFALVLLFALFGTAAFWETLGAAKSHQSQTFAGFQNSSQPNPFLQNTDDVRITITSYQGGTVLQQTVTAVSSASFSKDSASVAAAPAQPAAAGDIVFSQIYASGGNSGSTYQNNYLELFNRTNNTVDISGWRFYLSDATGTFNTSISFSSSRGIGIGAGHYLLMRFGPPSSNGAAT